MADGTDATTGKNSPDRAAKLRLDVLLVERGLAPSREQAQQYARAGWVWVDGAIADKPGASVRGDADVQVKLRPPYVSRGGEKLAGVLDGFGVDPRDRVCLDAGISTGGFTDCLLQHGAARVYGIDVGYGQVAWEIRRDPRVVLRERTNLRYLTPADLYGEGDPPADLVVADLSFISLTQVLPALYRLAAAPQEMLLLVKPQFEVGKGRVGKGGIVRDPNARAEAIANVVAAATGLGLQVLGMAPSPLRGRTGNQEYWLHVRAGSEISPPDATAIAALVGA